MKRLLILSACAMFSYAVSAQMQIKVPNFESLQKDITKSDEDLANPKKGTNPKTWVSRGEMYMNIYDQSTMGAAPGMNKIIFNSFTKNKGNETIGDKQYDVLIFPSIKMYFDAEKGGALTCWRETKRVIENPLGKSMEAYNKAIELDAPKDYTKRIKKGMEQLAQKARTEGINAYTLLDYKSAQQMFMLAVDAGTNPVVGQLDTVIAYYAGIMSLNDSVKDYDNAVKYLKLCINNSYYDNGIVYANLAKTYEIKGDTAAREQTLVDGFLKFPKNQSILIDLINMYLSAGNDATKVIPFLHKAQENEPGNGTLYFAEATLYEKLKMYDDAERMYKKTVEIDAKSFNAYYNLGAMYYNKAVEKLRESNSIKDWRSPKIKQLEDEANAEYRKAIDPFSKAYNLQPADRYTVETLKNIYARFRNENKDMMDKYNKYNDELALIKQQAAPVAAPTTPQ